MSSRDFFTLSSYYFYSPDYSYTRLCSVAVLYFPSGSKPSPNTLLPLYPCLATSLLLLFTFFTTSLSVPYPDCFPIPDLDHLTPTSMSNAVLIILAIGSVCSSFSSCVSSGSSCWPSPVAGVTDRSGVAVEIQGPATFPTEFVELLMLSEESRSNKRQSAVCRRVASSRLWASNSV
jgi:hypothetical protein